MWRFAKDFRLFIQTALQEMPARPCFFLTPFDEDSAEKQKKRSLRRSAEMKF
jgi:hypothetical protein